MLIKKVEEVVLFFDNEEEALINYEEIEALNNCTEREKYIKIIQRNLRNGYIK